MRFSIKASATIALTIALATVLGACSLLPNGGQAPTPTPTGESVTAACAKLDSEMVDVQDKMQQAAVVLNTKTADAAELLSGAASHLEHSAEDGVQNKKVVKVAIAVSESITALSDLLTKAAPDPLNADAAAINTAGDDVNTAFEAFTAVCPETVKPANAACDALKDEATAINAELSEASDLLTSDPTAGAAKLAAAAARFDQAAAAIDDVKVGVLATATSDSLNNFSALINTLAADPTNADTAALTAGGADLNSKFSMLASYCAWTP